jgi:hypothetical protein
LRPSRARRSLGAWIAVVLASALLVGCGGAHEATGRTRLGRGGASATTVAPSATSPSTASAPSTAVPPATAPPPDLATAPCQGSAPPARYDHVVVVMLENRTWASVGGPGFAGSNGIPSLAGLAQQCAYFEQWTETNRTQSSLTQYIGLTSGVDNGRTVDDCGPSAACSSEDDNIFREVRVAGGTARTYVDGASAPCSAGGNAAKHIPALYYRGSYDDAAGVHDDADFCATEVLPFAELDPDHLPTFAMVVPDGCHDGHDCGNAAVDGWLRVELAAILAGRDYRAGNSAVFVLWDEDTPVPNLVVAPSARPGPRPGEGSHAAALKTIELMLGLPVLPAVAGVADLRAGTPL